MNASNHLILIVDDNPKNLQLLSQMLSAQGYEVGVAAGGADALAFVDTHMPDLILLDVMMPDVDGFEVCQQLKKRQDTRHIPIIFLSAKNNTSTIVQGFALGAVDYVTKPFISEELFARVHTHLELKTLRGFLNICAKCKKVRDDDGNWEEIESYIEKHSKTLFSHGMCSSCSKELYGQYDWYKKMKGNSD